MEKEINDILIPCDDSSYLKETKICEILILLKKKIIGIKKRNNSKT